MGILSRIIVGHWFKSFIGSMIVFGLLITTTEFINGLLQGKIFSRIWLEYLLKMPELMSKTIPVCCMVATLFSFNKLKAHSELIAILASGFSYKKIYSIIIFSSLVVVFLQLANLGWLEPWANQIKRREIQKSQKSEGKYLTRSTLEGGRFWYKTQNYFSTFAYFDKKKNLLADLEVYFYSSTHSLKRIIRAEQAIYSGQDQWTLSGMTDYQDLDNSLFPKEIKSKEGSITLAEIPSDFAEFESDLTTLNIKDLSVFLRKLKKTGINLAEYEVILLNKFSLAISCLVFALIPLGTIYQPNRRSSSFGKSVVFTLLTTVIFWVAHSTALASGSSGKIPPFVATFLIPCLFLSYTLLLFIKHRRLAI